MYLNVFTYCPLSSCWIFEIEIGGLFTLDEMSLLKTVLWNDLSVLLLKNLNNYFNKKRDETISDKMATSDHTYFDEKMGVQISTPRVYFVWVLNSSSFNEINSLLIPNTIVRITICYF